MLKIVITGGLGFIFSYVTEFYVQKGWNVTVIDNLSKGSHPEILNGSFVHHNVDVATKSVVQLVREIEPDFIIHAAAISDVDYGIQDSYEVLGNNFFGNLHLFEAARQLPNLKKFIYISTDEVYGTSKTPSEENDGMFPTNPYSASKASGSLMVTAYTNTFPAMQGKIAEIRFCNIFGPRQDTRKIFPLIKRGLKEGVALPLHNQGKGYREYLYIKNVPEVVDLVFRKGEGIYNLTAGEGYTVNDLIKKAEIITGKKIPTYPSERVGMDIKYQTNNTKLIELGWQPNFSFEQGFREYLGI